MATTEATLLGFEQVVEAMRNEYGVSRGKSSSTTFRNCALQVDGKVFVKIFFDRAVCGQAVPGPHRHAGGNGRRPQIQRQPGTLRDRVAGRPSHVGQGMDRPRLRGARIREALALRPFKPSPRLTVGRASPIASRHDRSGRCCSFDSGVTFGTDPVPRRCGGVPRGRAGGPRSGDRR